MAKWHGKVGFVMSEEIRPSVWEDVVTEKFFKGDMLKLGSRWTNTEYKNDDLVIANRISILMDPWMTKHFHQIKFVVWKNAAFKVANIEVEYPRLTLELGGVYNGPRAESET